MNISFEITTSHWPFGGLLNETHRRKKINELKTQTCRQLKNFKEAVESDDIKHNAKLIDKIEHCKNNITKINDLISRYNQKKAHKKTIKLLERVDFNCWSPPHNVELPQEIYSHIVSFLPYEALMSWRKASKMMWKSIENSPYLKFRLNISQLNGCLLNKQESINSVDKIKYRLKKYKYRLFEKLIRDLTQLQKKEILNEKEVLQIRHDLLDVAEKSKHKLVYVVVHSRLQCFIKNKFTDSDYTELRNLAKMYGLDISNQEFAKLIANSANDPISNFTEIEQRLWEQNMGALMEWGGF